MKKIIGTIATMGLDAGLNVGQSLFNNRMAEQSTDKAYQRQLDFWNHQNAYNSPRAQRDRFARAGFNPSAVMGEIAGGQNAQQLSSVPQNEYAQSGMLKLSGLAETMEVLARIEKMGAETGLATEQMTSEALRQTLLGIGIDEAKVNYLIKQYEAEGKSLELDYLPAFYEHKLNMFDLEEQLSHAKYEHEQALTNLANAQTETEKENAKKVVAETGLLELKADTEKSIANLNYALSRKANSESDRIKWETRKSMVLAPFERKAMQLANELQVTENQKIEIEAALKQLDLDAKTNSDGDANAWYYIDRTLETIGNILGVAVGAALGSKTGAKAKSAGA